MINQYLIIILSTCFITSCDYFTNYKTSDLPENTINKQQLYSGQIVFYYETGQVKYIENFKQGKKHGKYTIWYKNGRIKTKGNYNNGKRLGNWIWFNEQGQANFIINYDKSFS